MASIMSLFSSETLYNMRCCREIVEGERCRSAFFKSGTISKWLKTGVWAVFSKKKSQHGRVTLCNYLQDCIWDMCSFRISSELIKGLVTPQRQVESFALAKRFMTAQSWPGAFPDVKRNRVYFVCI